MNYLLVLVILALHDNFGNAMCPNSSGNFTFTVNECGNDVISCIRDKTANLTRGDCVNVFLEGGNYTVLGNLTVGLSLRPSTSSLVSLTCTEAGEERNDSFLSVENSSYLELFRISFSSCNRAVEANNVETVIIDSSSFKNMNGSGALNIYNCLNVTVVDTIFTDCINQGRFLEPYRGNSGALSIGFEMESNQSNSYIENCTFNASFALGNQTSHTDLVGVSHKNIFNGHGGGLALIFNATSGITVHVIGSTFYGNNASVSGGAIMVFLEEDLENSDILIKGNYFLENCADRGGGITVALNRGISLGINSLNVTENYFKSNKAAGAAGLLVINQKNNDNISLENSCFENNEGSSVVMFSSVIGILQSGNTQKNGTHTPSQGQAAIENMRFINNTAKSGVVVALFTPLILKGETNFTKNRGSSLKIVSSVVRLEDYLGFFDNVASGDRGGAIFFSNGQIELTRGSEIAMEGNIGSIGAAIFSEPLYAQSQFFKAIGNPSCFFVYEEDDNKVVVQDWNASVIISSNKAQVGSAIYADQIEQCSYYIDESPFFNVTCFFDGNVCDNDNKTSISSPFTFSNNTNIKQGNSTRHHHLSIATPPAKFKIACSNLSFTSYCTKENNTLKVEAFPGETIAIALSVLDDLNFPTYGVISLEIADDSKSKVHINDTVFSIYPDEPNYFFSYTFQSDLYKKDIVNIIGSLSSTGQRRDREFFYIEISPKLCPVGQFLNGSCKCSFDKGVVHCDSLATTLILKPNLWGLVVRENDEHGKLHTTFCPPGYCRCNISSTSLSRKDCNSVFNLNDPNSQCSCGRHGYLCGSCNEGFSVSALFLHCEVCNDGYGALIALLILIDSIVIVIIQTLPIYMEKLKMNSILYSALFFFQIAPYATSRYPVFHGDYYETLRYFGSLLGLYFPYDVCLYNNATALEAFSIRYVPFILALIITPTVIGIMWLLRTRQKITYEGVWIVWMLILNDVFATSFGVLNCTSLPDQNNQARLVWFYDGTVECFSGAHAALAVWAILVLLLCILATGFLLLVMRHPEKFTKLQIVQNMIEPVRNGFLDDYQWWFAIDIARRFLLIACLVFVSHAENAAMFVLSVYFWMYAYFKPYKLITSNIFELLLLFNFWIMETLISVAFLHDIIINDTPSEQLNCDGNNVKWPSKYIAPFIIIYYLSVLYLFLPITVAIVRKCSPRINAYMKYFRNASKRQKSNPHANTALSKNVICTSIRLSTCDQDHSVLQAKIPKT